jgi:hypothetical protein
MNLAKVSDLTSRTFGLVSFGLLGLAVLEKLCNIAGFTLVRGSVAPQRLLEYATVLILFVIAMLVREIRETVVKG